MSSPVATSVDIWQNAEAGEVMLIACQLRSRTRTIRLLRISLILL